MNITILDRGRGPEIDGSRITVYDLLDYSGEHPPEFLAELFDLTLDQIHAALLYIDENRDSVMAAYEAMLDRDQQGNSPAVRARLDEARQRFEMLREVRKRQPDRYKEIMAAHRLSRDAYRNLLTQSYSELTKGAPLARAPR